jgi:uncharacterized protein (TIGR03067 family)
MRKRDLKLIVKGSKCMISSGGKGEIYSELILNARTTPGQVQWVARNDKNQSKSIPGIFELKGDEIRFCLAKPGQKERPTEFRSENGTLLLEFRRVKW